MGISIRLSCRISRGWTTGPTGSWVHVAVDGEEKEEDWEHDDAVWVKNQAIIIILIFLMMNGEPTGLRESRGLTI